MAKKVLDHELKRLASEGKGVRAMARELKVTPGCISKRLKGLNCVVAHGITLYRPDEKTGSINMIDQFILINKQANTLLNKLVKACEKVESLPGDKIRLRDPRDLLIRLLGEIKSQIDLWHELEKTRFNAVVVREFMNELVRFLGEIDEDARKQFTDRVNQNRTLRGVFD